MIELLVVVAIISILASIAVPNFLEAQTRAKVARIQSDMRVLAIGVESYRVDYGVCPPRHSDVYRAQAPEFRRQGEEMSRLTTPEAYITTLPLDIFNRSAAHPYLIDYYDPSQTSWFVAQSRGSRYRDYQGPDWLALSVGPDGFLGVLPSGNPGGYPPQPPMVAFSLFRVYDPSNGTTSVGNIFRFSGLQDPHEFLNKRF